MLRREEECMCVRERVVFRLVRERGIERKGGRVMMRERERECSGRVLLQCTTVKGTAVAPAVGSGRERESERESEQGNANTETLTLSTLASDGLPRHRTGQS